jgi:hypothetical protein
MPSIFLPEFSFSMHMPMLFLPVVGGDPQREKGGNVCVCVFTLFEERTLAQNSLRKQQPLLVVSFVVAKLKERNKVSRITCLPLVLYLIERWIRRED